MDSEQAPRTDRTLSESPETESATLLGEMSNVLDLCVVVEYVEQMSAQEIEDIWMELDALT